LRCTQSYGCTLQVGIAREMSVGDAAPSSEDAISSRVAIANSMMRDDRDFVAESLFDVALLGASLAHGEEAGAVTSAEFNFARWATTSRQAPRCCPEENSDVANSPGEERATHRQSHGLLVVLKAALSYNRDLQEDKEPLFDSFRQILLVLRALTGAYVSLEFHHETAGRGG